MCSQSLRPCLLTWELPLHNQTLEFYARSLSYLPSSLITIMEIFTFWSGSRCDWCCQNPLWDSILLTDFFFLAKLECKWLEVKVCQCGFVWVTLGAGRDWKKGCVCLPTPSPADTDATQTSLPAWMGEAEHLIPSAATSAAPLFVQRWVCKEGLSFMLHVSKMIVGEQKRNLPPALNLTQF